MERLHVQLTMRRLLFAAAAVWFVFPAVFARSDFEISLREGGTVLAQSYRIEGDKLVAYKPSGEVQIDRARVVNIRDRGANPVIRPARAAAPAEASPKEAGATVATAATPSQAAVDPAARERELSRAVIIGYRDLMFARNRGENKEEIEKRKAEIKKLETERASLQHETAQGAR